jgi:hypothetical protein
VRKVSKKDGNPMMIYYNAGVGSCGPTDRFLGGVFGVGLRNNVKRGLALVAQIARLPATVRCCRGQTFALAAKA